MTMPKKPHVHADYGRGAKTAETFKTKLPEIINAMVYSCMDGSNKTLQQIATTHGLNKNFVAKIANDAAMREVRQVWALILQMEMMAPLQKLIQKVNSDGFIENLPPKLVLDAIPKIVAGIQKLEDVTGGLKLKLTVTATASEAQDMNKQVYDTLRSAGFPIATTGLPEIGPSLEDLIDQIEDAEILQGDDDGDDASEPDEFHL